MKTETEATVEDLYRIEGKAEIVNGKIVRLSPTGDMPGSAAGAIFVSLHQYSKRTRIGRAYGDIVGYQVDLPNRQSFSPDASYFTGDRAGMKFLNGSPDFAVEVRSENDYGRSAEVRIAKKRREYFLAGTKVVWDVDLLSPDVIKSYPQDDPENPTIHRRGEVALAEPAVPGWTMPVDDLFD